MASVLSANDMAALNGFFKVKYSDNLSKIIPEDARMQQMVKFLPKNKQPGLTYHQPIILGLEQGFTYAGKDGEVVALNDHVSGQVKPATIAGYEILLRSAIPYSAVTRSSGDDKAYESALKFVVSNMVDSFTKRMEIELMYGQYGIGRVANNETAGSSVVVEIQASEWAPGIWGGAEKMKLDFYSALTSGTLRNVASGDAVVSSVDFDNKTITITSLTANLTAGDYIFPAGAYGKQMKGLHAIMKETTDLFGINPSQYNLWKATEYAAGSSVLSFNVLQKAVARGVARGFKGKAIALVNPEHWDDLLTDENANRMYDSSYDPKKMEKGNESITFYAQNGSLTIIPSIYCKQGYCYIFNPDMLARVGSTDITFNRPGYGTDNFFLDLPGHNGLELRALTDQALFTAKPSCLILVSGLVIS